jgi:phage protein D
MSLASFLGLDTRDTGECIVKIGGSEFSEFYQNLQTTRVTLKRRDSAEAALTFAMLRDPDGSWPLAEDPRVRTWAQVEILVVFGDTEEPFFSGYIREINSNIPERGSVATVTLNCQDIFAAMDRNCRRVTWDEGRQSLDIIREIIAPYGLTLQTDLSATPVDSRHQNKTDYRFIRELAEENNYEWYLRDRQGGVRELYFGPPRASAEAGGNKLMIHAGRQTNCLSFNVAYDGYQPDRIRVATAPLTGDEIEQASEVPELQLFGNRGADSSDSGLDDFEWCLPPGDGNNGDKAGERAQGEAEERAFKLKATGRLDGTAYGALLLPGSVVEVGGSGANNGKWYVDSATHTFDASGYFVDFELIRNAAAGDETGSDHILAGVI